MQINEMNLEEVEARLAEITSEVETRSGEELETLKAETEELLVRKAELEELEKRTADAEALTEGSVEPDAVIEEGKIEEVPQEERKMITRESVEYRDAFLAVCAGKATAEQRTIFADNTVSGDGASLPIGLDTQIWDQIYTNHPILDAIEAAKKDNNDNVTVVSSNDTADKKIDRVNENVVSFESAANKDNVRNISDAAPKKKKKTKTSTYKWLSGIAISAAAALIVIPTLIYFGR